MIYRESLHARTHKRQAARRQLHIGAQALAVLLGMMILVAVALIVISLDTLVPAQAAPQTRSEDYPRAIAAVQQRFTGQVEDPLHEVAQDVFVRESNLKGIVLEGVTYYYAVQGHQSFDPLSRGSVDPEHIEVIYRTEGSFPLVIYYIRDSE